MIGGTLIEVRAVDLGTKDAPRLCWRLWAADPRTPAGEPDECAVHAEVQLRDTHPRPGDAVWWQAGHVYWTPADRHVVDHPLVKVGNSFDPRKVAA